MSDGGTLVWGRGGGSRMRGWWRGGRGLGWRCCGVPCRKRVELGWVDGRAEAG